MKKLLSMLFVLSALMGFGGEDIHEDVVVWLRGDSDINGDGILQDGEVVDAISPIHSDAIKARGWMDGDVQGASGDFRWTNDVVTIPYTGRLVPGAVNYCFRQSIRSGNNAVKPSTIELTDVARNITSENWSFHMRFIWEGRPISPQSQPQVLLVAGKSTASSEGHGMEWDIQNDGKFVCWIGDKPFMTFVLNATQIESNKWTDAVFVFKEDGNISVSVMQQGSGLVSKTISCADDKKYRPDPNGSFIIGNSTADPGWGYYLNGALVNRAFRGQINQFAVWNRALSEDDVKRVLSWPGEDLVRAGIADGRSNEFDGEGETSSAALDADAGWGRFGGVLTAGASKTLSIFVPERYNGLPQVLRWRGASDSDTGTIELIVNGKSACSRSVSPGAWTLFPIAGESFVSNAVTTLTLKRTDAGKGAVKTDALAVGGSWQEGTISGNQYENGVMETTPETFHVPDGDFKHFRNRAEIGYAMKLAFDVPEPIVDSYRHRLVFKSAFFGNTPEGIKNVNLAAYVNGTKIYTDTRINNQWFLREIKLPRQLLQAGRNEIRFVNEGDPTGAPGFFSFDYIQLQVGNPLQGLFLLIK